MSLTQHDVPDLVDYLQKVLHSEEWVGNATDGRLGKQEDGGGRNWDWYTK